jgi:hypothetical protein
MRATALSADRRRRDRVLTGEPGPQHTVWRDPETPAILPMPTGKRIARLALCWFRRLQTPPTIASDDVGTGARTSGRQRIDRANRTPKRDHRTRYVQGLADFRPVTTEAGQLRLWLSRLRRWPPGDSRATFAERHRR